MVTDDTNVPVYKYPTYDDVRFDKNEFKEVHYPKVITEYTSVNYYYTVLDLSEGWS